MVGQAGEEVAPVATLVHTDEVFHRIRYFLVVL